MDDLNPRGDGSGAARESARWFPFALGALVLCTALLRLPTLWGGMPYEVHHDEILFLRLATKVVTSGDLNPHFANWGSLPIHAMALLLQVASWFGLTLEPVGPGSYLLARVVSLVWISVSMAAIGASAARVFGARVGLFAAALLAVSPLHAELARRGLVEPWMAGAFALSGLASVRAWQRDGNARDLVLAGGLAGLATAMKLTGAVACLQPFLAWALSRQRPARTLVASAAAAIATWAVCTPFAWLDAPTFLAGLTGEAQHYSSDHSLFPRVWATSHYEYTLLLDLAVGTPALVAALVGLVLALRRCPRALLVCIGGAAAHVLFVGMFRFYYPRNLLTGLGALAPLAALGIVLPAALWVRRPRMQLALSAVLGLAILLPPAGASHAKWARLRLPETRAQAAAWLTQHLPPNARVVVESTAPAPVGRDDVVLRIVGAVCLDLDLALADGVEFVVLSSMVHDIVLASSVQLPWIPRRYDELYARGQVVQTFAPEPGRSRGPTIQVLRLEPVDAGPDGER